MKEGGEGWVTITHENGFSMESELWWKGVEEI
jgi:hypothetical protein